MTATMSTILNRPYLPEGGGGITCELVIDPESKSTPAERHIAICIDTSGSMASGNSVESDGEPSESKMDQIRDAMKIVFGLLDDDDHLSIVTFDDQVEVIMPPTRWGDIDREEAQQHLEEIQPGGGTDIYSGLETALEGLEELDGGDNVSRRILLLSDGRDVRAKPPDFERLARDSAEAGISVYAAGIGSDYGQETIQTIGNQSQGRWAHVEQPVDIRSFFGDVVQEASSVLANNPRLVLDPVDRAEIGMAFRRLPQVQTVDLEHENGTVIVGLPDLQDGKRQEVLLKLDAPPGDVGTEQTLVEATLESDGALASCDISVSYTDDEAELSKHNTDVTVLYHDTDLRTRIANADSEADVADAKAKIDETETIVGETNVPDDLHENVTRIQEGDDSEARMVRADTTVLFQEDRFV
jgi:Ca-activated chloride channel family protein